MPSAARLWTTGLLLCLVAVTTGCETTKKSWRRVRHEFQPHRMNRLNQWDGPSLDTGQFSVQDPIPQRGWGDVDVKSAEEVQNTEACE